MSAAKQTHHGELLPQLVDDFLVSSGQRDSVKHGQTGERRGESKKKIKIQIRLVIGDSNGSDTGGDQVAQDVIPGDDKEGDGEGLGRERVQQRLEAEGQLGDGDGQRLPGGGVVHKRPAGLGAVDPDTPRGKTDVSSAQWREDKDKRRDSVYITFHSRPGEQYEPPALIKTSAGYNASSKH